MNKTIIKIPSLNTTVDSNPEMFCNLAREDPNRDVCSTCDKKDCKHHGKSYTINMKNVSTY